MLTIIADSNVAHLNTYFNATILGHPINLVAMAGRDINASVIKEHQPDALIIRSVTQVDAHLLQDNHSVKFVGSATIGTDHVNQDYLNQRGIMFANAAGCSKHSVAQYVISAITTLRPHYWQTPVTLGIIGMGNIGSTLTQYAQDLGWTILGYDPFLPASAVNNATLEQLLTQSDVVSLHVPLTTQATSTHPTYHLINESTLSKLKSDALLINTARGPVIEERALLLTLGSNNYQSDRVTKGERQVVLDVFEHEPAVSDALLQHLAIATPHIAGYTIEGKLRGTQMIFDKFVPFFADKLNVERTYLMDELLPPNPYNWSQLQANPSKRQEFYDIKQDNELLRDAVSIQVDKITKQKVPKVSGNDFDALRKNYALRREWIYNGAYT